MPRYNVNPGLAIEAAVRQEVLGHGGVWFNGRVMSSNELRELAELPENAINVHGKRIFKSVHQ
jgi:hypothetical protein